MTDTKIFNPVTNTYRSSQIAYTCVHGTVISTIKLPDVYDGAGYETMMYNKDSGVFEDFQERYATEEAAIAGHIQVINSIVDRNKETA